MPIPRTRLHLARVVDQIRQNLVGLQTDMNRNAQTHRAMAVAQSPNLATLRTFMNDAAAAYLTRLQWLIDLRADATKRQRMLDILTLMGWTEADITDAATPLRTAALALQAAPKTTFAQMITACDAVIAEVAAPDSLWPE